MMHFDIPSAWACIVIFALSMYIILDGFDLGVGILLLTAKEEMERDLMVRSIAPVWDGNETWMVLTGVALLGGFPLAYSILLPAFYFPIIGMLLCLVFRGTAFEFRFQTVKYRKLWDLTFSFGSIGAALCQGMLVGGLAAGVRVNGEAFGGSAFDFLTPFSLFTGLGLVAAYAFLGALWLAYRMRDGLRQRAEKIAQLLLPVFVLAAFLGTGWAALVQPRLAHTWRSPLVPIAISLLFLSLAGLCVVKTKAGEGRWAFLCSVGMFLTVFGSTALAFWPYLIPFDFTLWQAASPENSQMVLLVGVSIAIPIILTYSAYSYFVFRGQVTAEDAETPNFFPKVLGDAD